MKTVSKLITELEAVLASAGDVPVLVYGYEEDYDAATGTKIVRVADKGEREKELHWWSGRYEDIETADPALPRFDAVVIQSE
ncbi:hypothetical protein [Brevibacterium gallinarum]|uniref:Uncharacterized protein n=1 Tax=Brevibacterium gallinarum TaxID=2762220 RepID=A0ABR8WQP2_9MICO|nr:hypothetical protein [Brevibacterium gallinarum]MBD8019370.1 hypothetical protein [Brevibacterium gallinarum]